MFNIKTLKENAPFNKNKFISGFTLIELLVVIAIIGILASTMLASLNGARAKARNARERVDVRQIINALELARNANPLDQYPLSAGGGTIWNCLKPSGTCWKGSYSALPAQAVSDLAPYLPTLPLTAINAPGSYASDSYLYISNFPSAINGIGGPGTWLIWAKESATPFAPGECPGVPTSHDFGIQYCYQYLGTN